MPYIPSYINQTIDARARELVTHERWNELLNLLILQGDANAEALNKIINTGELEPLGMDARCTALETTDATHTAQIALKANTADIYTRTQLNAGQLNNLYFTETELQNGALDSRYFTETELQNGALDSRYFTETEIQTNYYSKQYLDSKMENDTVIKYDVFTIVHSDNGDGTFTYNTGPDTDNIIGTITAEGYQRFELLHGTYIVGNNRIEAYINDALTRSAASGGLREVGDTDTKSTTIDLTSPAGDTSEVTFKYFERIGLTGEHAGAHAVGGGDELIALQSTEPAVTFPGQLFFEVVE